MHVCQKISAQNSDSAFLYQSEKAAFQRQLLQVTIVKTTSAKPWVSRFLHTCFHALRAGLSIQPHPFKLPQS